MGKNLTGVVVISLALTACANGGATTTSAGPPDTTGVAPATTRARPEVKTTTVTTLPSGRDATTTSTAAPGATTTTTIAHGDPAQAWETGPLGFDATHDLRIAHGPLGFLAVDHSPAGPMVRLSADGRQWRETGVLRGPGGEQEVDVAGLAVTGDEFVVVGQVWSPAAGEAAPTRSAIWRSPDGASWDAREIGYLVSAVVATSAGLVLIGSDVSAGGSLLGSVVEVERDGRWVDIAATRTAFAGVHGADGGAAVGGGLVVWGASADGATLAWHSPDLEEWTGLAMPADAPGHVQGAAPLGDDVVLLSPARSWRLDGSRLVLLASNADFALDAASGGFAEFRTVTNQGGILAALAEVVEKAGMAWCLADADDCFRPTATALVSRDGRDWRRIPLPGDQVAIDEPYEVAGFTVDGSLGVVHEVDGVVMLSVLTDPTASVPLNTGAAPDLAHPAADAGIDLEEGRPYGLRVWTHCGMPNIGPYDGTFWVALEVDDLQAAKGQNEWVAGFVQREGERITFRLDDPEDGRVLAVYGPDADAGETLCY